MFYNHLWELEMSRDCRQKSMSQQNDLNWPPATVAEMRAWQQQVGTDLEIARHLGLSRASVYGQRIKFGLAALPRKKRARVREKRPGARMTKFQIARLYAGRSYEDRLSAPPLRGPMPPNLAFREPAPATYSVAAE